MYQKDKLKREHHSDVREPCLLVVGAFDDKRSCNSREGYVYCHENVHMFMTVLSKVVESRGWMLFAVSIPS